MRCARCGRWFFAHSPVNANWCATDGVFVCRRCRLAENAPPGCPECHGPTTARTALGIVLLILFVVMFGTFGGVVTGQALWDQHFQNTPSIAIANASVGSTIKLAGTIGGTPGTVVIDGVYVSAGKSSHWDWTIQNFLLVVGSTLVSVEASGIGAWVYGAPHSLSSNHEQYWSGDQIAVVGVVQSPTTLSGTAVATGPNAFLAPWEVPTAEILDAVAVTAAGAGIAVHLRSRSRFRSHAARLASGTPFAYHPEPPLPP